jgi:hypothetical protein
MQIQALRKFRGRNPRGYFQDLPWETRQRAYEWLNKFVTRRKVRLGFVPRWLFAIYVGQAKRLALNPPTATWGRSMLARRGGYAVQRQYQAEGRTGKLHPAHLAASVSASKRLWQKTVRERARQGIKPSRQGFTNLDGI